MEKKRYSRPGYRELALRRLELLSDSTVNGAVDPKNPFGGTPDEIEW